MKKEMIKGALFGLIVALLIPFNVKAETVTLEYRGVQGMLGGRAMEWTPNVLNGQLAYNGLKQSFFIYPWKNEAIDSVQFYPTNGYTKGTYDITGFFAVSYENNEFPQNVHFTVNKTPCITSLQHVNNSNSSYIYYFTFSCSSIYNNGSQNGLTFELSSNSNSSTFYMGQVFNFTQSSSTGFQSINDNIDDMKDKQDQTNKELGDLNNNITNGDVGEASSSANDFFTGFESDDFGLTAIVTAPLNFIKSITSSTCSSLGFPMPFVDQRVELPCMNSIYKQYFGSFLTIYQTITFGIVAYWVCVNVLATVRGFKDPESDKIEVLEL